MRKTKRILFVLFALFSMVISSCSNSANNNISNYSQIVENEEQQRIYAMYKAAGGEMTYEEWLNSIRGADGSSILYGMIEPDSSQGKNGDIYINASTWDVFVKNGNTWVKIGNVMGQQGPKGDTGETGPQGPAGKDGQDGQDGVSIVSIIKTSSNGLIDVYTITYSDGHTSTFLVTNGASGQDGTNGQNGADGQTPYIGENGHWWIGDVDTGISAQGPKGDTGEQGQQGIQGIPGADGHTPVITISEDGYWVVDGVKTSTLAQGPAGQDGADGQDGQDGADGQTPYIGSNGNRWIGDFDTGIGAQGPKGDNGDTGPAGADGKDGRDGIDGQDGVSIVDTYLDENGDLIIVYSNGTTTNAGNVANKNVHTVTFNSDGGSPIEPQLVLHGEKIRKPDNPVKDGYSFGGWTYQGEPWIFYGYTVTEDITLNANWNHNHNFNQTIIDENMLKSEPTCTQAATYYYSCECGEIGQSFFSYGTPLGHTFDERFVCEKCHQYASDILNGNYCKTYLSKMPNGNNYVSFYNEIFNACSYLFVSKENVGDFFATVDYEKYSLSQQEAVAIYFLVRDDCPLFYYLPNFVNCSNQSLLLTTYDLYKSASYRNNCNETIVEQLDEISKYPYCGSSNYNISQYLHDYVINRIDYLLDDLGQPSDEPEAHNVIGVFSGNGGVCESYAKSFQLLLNYFGINNIYVTGKANNDNHAWNLVELDNEFYWFDLTFDDTYISSYDCDCDWEKYMHSYKADNDFLGTHILFEENTLDSGADYHIGYPLRASENLDLPVRLYQNEFIIDDIKYWVSSATTVNVVSIYKAGDVIIPETISHNGARYIVTTISNTNDATLNLDTTSITLPKTIKNIFYGLLFYAPYYSNYNYKIENIYVDDDNPYYDSVDGVVYNKSHKTIIAYPMGSTRKEYTVLEETIAAREHVFDFCCNLEKINFSKNFQIFGLATNFEEKPGHYWDMNFPSLKFNGAVASIMKNNVNLKYNHGLQLNFDDDNPYYCSKDSILYALFENAYHPDTDTYESVQDAWIVSFMDPQKTNYKIEDSINHLGKSYEIVGFEPYGIRGYFENYEIYDFSYLTSSVVFDTSENDNFEFSDGILYYRKDLTHLSIVWADPTLETVHLLDGVESLNTIWISSTTLKTIYLPSSIREIFCEFLYCTSLQDVYYDGTIAEWEQLYSIFCDEVGCFSVLVKDTYIHCLDGTVIVHSNHYDN